MQARERRVVSAVRRVVVTPTFAAGLGVVIAAALAYPMTRTIFRYGVQPCHVKDCGVGTGHASGIPVPRSPSRRLVTPTPSPSSRRHQAVPSAHRSGSAPASGPLSRPGAGSSQGLSSHGRPDVQFRKLYQGAGDFVAELTIAHPPTGGWRLEFTYPSARIMNVVGARKLSLSEHTAVVEPLPPLPLAGDRQPSSQGASVMIEIDVTGRAKPPASCLLNGHTCRYVVAHDRSHR